MDLDLKKNSIREINLKLRNGFSGNILNSSSRMHVLAIGLKTGNLVIKGNVGDYFGALNDGCKIKIDGKAKRYLADNMTNGEIIVNECGRGAGTAMHRGFLVVRGDAEDFIGQINRSGVILVDGNADESAGFYMMDGSIIITKNAGKMTGDHMVGGSIFVGGKIESIGNNAVLGKLSQNDISMLASLFSKYGIKADSKNFKKVVAKQLRPIYKEEAK